MYYLNNKLESLEGCCSPCSDLIGTFTVVNRLFFFRFFVQLRDGMNNRERHRLIGGEDAATFRAVV